MQKRIPTPQCGIPVRYIVCPLEFFAVRRIPNREPATDRLALPLETANQSRPRTVLQSEN